MKAGETVFICEGERMLTDCVHWAHRYTNAGGAESGKNLTIIPKDGCHYSSDNDPPGRKHGLQVAGSWTYGANGGVHYGSVGKRGCVGRCAGGTLRKYKSLLSGP